ncbi:elongin-A-like isoform X1 [Rissa tridactyla]|uniref:elongin-A-like isoform X1 n=1 Tax=Rissa tridactyla TaxID=75485 RepID=UPI0023BAD4E4|nr:elongin-A-like isoform X1 [Rissa tridactyla]
MAEGRSVARRVLELKELLGCAQEPEEIIKTLKVLQDLDISLDILVETGIGKTVNSFRKHATAGNVAKTLVKQWKKLIPPENKSGPRGRKQNTEKEKDETKASVSEEVKHPEKSKASVLASRSSNSAPILKKLNKQRTCSEKTHRSRDRESQKECDNKEWSSSSKHASHSNNPQAKESDFKERTTTDSKKVSEKQCSSVANKDLPSLKEKPSKDASKQRNPKHVKKPNQKLVIKSKVELSSEEKQCSSVANKDLPSLKEKPSKDASKQRNPKHVEKPNQKLIIKSKVELSSEEEFEPPTMSFESYLNYDQVTKKRKRKACSTGERTKCSEQNNSLPQKASKFFHEKEREDDEKKSENDQSETPNKKTFTEESDRLWKKHCQRDFKNESLLEYESWREMYLRLFNQREEKLKTLTKNIISAQSEKPKGRQVKMAYVTSAAKPPRNIRRQQEIHGTAGPVTQLHPIEKCKLRIAESRHRNNSSSNPIPASNSGSSSSSVMPQDGKKPIKKIAPIMRKTLKALKSRAGRR